MYAPPPKPRTTERGRYDPRPSDSEAVATWRQRMGTEAAREVYSRRGPTAELRNAQFRNQGLRQFGVRGRKRAQAVALIHAITHNHQVIRRLTNTAI